jgi:hypothetical protein
MALAEHLVATTRGRDASLLEPERAGWLWTQPQVASTAAILGRMIRYGFFNGVRADLADDPWAWPWSTLRDLGGATASVWTPVKRIASTLRLSVRDTLRALTTLGDARPPLPERSSVAAASLDGVRDAVASALRLSDPRAWAKAAARRLVVQTCYEIGAPRPGDLADALACSERSVHRDRSPRDPALDAVLLCLGDARLRIHGLSLSLPTSRRRSA